jgi:WD40 repeat protein
MALFQDQLLALSYAGLLFSVKNGDILEKIQETAEVSEIATSSTRAVFLNQNGAIWELFPSKNLLFSDTSAKLLAIDASGRIALDGNRIAAGQLDGTVSIWSTQTGRLLITLSSLSGSSQALEDFLYRNNYAAAFSFYPQTPPGSAGGAFSGIPHSANERNARGLACTSCQSLSWNLLLELSPLANLERVLL